MRKSIHIGIAVLLAGILGNTLAFAKDTGANSVIQAVKINQHAAAMVPGPIKKKGSITVASDASYPPFEYYASNNETMIGYDIDVADAIGKTLGLRIKHINVPFSSIIPGLAAGRYDMALSGFGVTAARQKVVSFVAPYFKGGSGLAVAPGNPLHLRMQTSALCGHTIGGEAGTYQVIDYLPEMSRSCVKAGKSPITIQVYKTQTQANLALNSGRVDGVMADSAPLSYEVKISSGKFELAPGPQYKPVPFGIALPKKSPLKPAIAKALDILKANGTLAKLLKKWNMPSAWLVRSGD